MIVYCFNSMILKVGQEQNIYMVCLTAANTNIFCCSCYSNLPDQADTSIFLLNRQTSRTMNNLIWIYSTKRLLSWSFFLKNATNLNDRRISRAMNNSTWIYSRVTGVSVVLLKECYQVLVPVWLSFLQLILFPLNINKMKY